MALFRVFRLWAFCRGVFGGIGFRNVCGGFRGMCGVDFGRLGLGMLRVGFGVCGSGMRKVGVQGCLGFRLGCGVAGLKRC